MTNEERQVSDFIRQFHQICLEERDIGPLSQMLSEDIEWIGAGKYGLAKGKNTILERFYKEKESTELVCRILSAEYEITTRADHLYSFRGNCYVRRESGGTAGEECEVRITGICRFEDGKGAILALHHSLPDSRWLNTPQLQAAENMRVLRSLIGLQSKELEEKNSNLDALIQNIPGGVICCRYDKDLELIFYSDGFLNMFGYTREEIETLFHNKFSRMIVPEDLAATWEDVKRQLKKGNTKEIEYRIICKDGSFLVVQDRGQLVMREGKPVFYCILIDVTEQKKADEELKMSLERYQIVMNQTTDIMFEWDVRKDTLRYSPNWIKKFGYMPAEEDISRRVPEGEHLHPADRKIFIQMQEEILRGIPCGENEIRIARQDGDYLWCRIHYTLQTDQEGAPIRAIGLITDINREKREKDKLKERADQDSLTGLYNRGAAQTLIQRYVVKAKPGDWCALLILDVDNFKRINDVYGHLSGDSMLKDIASLLRRLFPHQAVIGRVGGDEFAVLMYHVASKREVEEQAKAILDNFQYILQQQESFISCSIGISIAPGDGENFASIYKNADSALYQAKRRGKNCFAFYEETIEHGIPLAAKESAGSGEFADQKTRDQETRDRGTKDQEMADQSLTGYVLDILSRSQYMERSINQLLEIIGRQFNVSRVYIFEDDDYDCRISTNTFEWCNEGIQSELGNLMNVDMDALDHYYDNFNEEGIFFCKDVSTLLTHQRMMLERQGIRSVLQCRIMDGGLARGFIGFDECKENRYWTGSQIRTLQIISRILGIFLLKERAQEKLRKGMEEKYKE